MTAAVLAKEPRVWTFLSNHAHVLVCLENDPEIRVRDMAGKVGITERAVQKILSDLEKAGVIAKIRLGRRNRYAIDKQRPLRHPLEQHRAIADLLCLVG